MPRKDKVTFKKATLPFPVAAAVLVSMLQCAAHAAPTISLSGIYSKADILLVAQGCGAGFHREAYGYCVPNGRVVVPPPAIAPPVVVAARVSARLSSWSIRPQVFAGRSSVPPAAPWVWPTSGLCAPAPRCRIPSRPPKILLRGNTHLPPGTRIRVRLQVRSRRPPTSKPLHTCHDIEAAG